MKKQNKTKQKNNSFNENNSKSVIIHKPFTQTESQRRRQLHESYMRVVIIIISGKNHIYFVSLIHQSNGWIGYIGWMNDDNDEDDYLFIERMMMMMIMWNTLPSKHSFVHSSSNQLPVKYQPNDEWKFFFVNHMTSKKSNNNNNNNISYDNIIIIII